MDRILERLRRGEGPPLRVSELAEAAGCSRGYIHKLIKAGAIEHGRVGSDYTIPVTEARKVAEATGALPK